MTKLANDNYHEYTITFDYIAHNNRYFSTQTIVAESLDAVLEILAEMSYDDIMKIVHIDKDDDITIGQF